MPAPTPPFCMTCGPDAALVFDARTRIERCPVCGTERTPRPGQPLFVVTGPSGTGKTSVVDALRVRLSAVCEVFDTDLTLHVAALGWDTWRNTWLQLAHAIGEHGRPSVFCGSFAPDAFDNLPARYLVGPIHVCTLDCPADVLAVRLRARPTWRGCTEEFVAEHQRWGELLRQRVRPSFDTHQLTIDQTADGIAAWVQALLAGIPNKTKNSGTALGTEATVQGDAGASREGMVPGPGAGPDPGQA